MVKKDFTDKKDTANGPVAEVPKDWIADKDDIKSTQKEYQDAYAREKQRLEKKDT